MKVRRTIQSTIVLLVSFFIFLAMQTAAYADEVIPKATDQFYINDFADVFSPEQEEIMQQRAVALAEEPEGVQVVVTTVDTLSGYTVDEYATMMYNNYQIGLDSRGILILLSTGERQIRVEVGDGLTNFYSDAKAGEAIDKYALDYLKDNKFDQGLMNLQEKIVAELDEHFDIVSEDPQRTSDKGKNAKAVEEAFVVIGMCFIIPLVPILLFLAIVTLVDYYSKPRRLISQIEEISSSSGSGCESRLFKCYQLYREYREMNTSQQRKISDELIDKLTALIADGEREQQERIARQNAIRVELGIEPLDEEEDRIWCARRSLRGEDYNEDDMERIRMGYYPSSSLQGHHSSNKSHHSGFDGHSSGGGSSRGF